MSSRRRFAVAASAALLLPATLALAACGGSTDSTSNSASVSTEISRSSTASSESSSTSPSSSSVVPLPDVSLPDGVEPGSDAALAWEALMDPEGEYAAAASYAAVIDAFGPVEPYVTIKEGEERHIDALTRQLDRMGVDVPPNPYLGILPAPADLQAAAQAWADGEVLNVALYDDLLAQTDDANLTRVFTNLRRASLEEHLPAFQAAADNGGTLTEEQMAEYVHAGGMGGGMGGNGHGPGHDETDVT